LWCALAGTSAGSILNAVERIDERRAPGKRAAMMLEDLYRLLRSGHVQAQGVVDTMTQPIVVIDQNLCVTTANNAFIKTFSVQRDDILGQNFFGLGNGQWDIAELRHLIGTVIPKAAAVMGFEVEHDFPGIGKRTFLVDARRLVHPDDNSSNILVLFDDVTERRRHDIEATFVLEETRHRMKNLFAVVRSLAMQTGIECTAAEYRDAFLGRIEATLRAQQIATHDEATDFEALLKQSVGAAGEDRLRCKGPAVNLRSKLVLPVSMIFHELTTNAVKYGALSVTGGEIDVAWSVEDGPRDRKYLVCRWQENNGPSVNPPTRKGYGTELIAGTASHLGGSVEHWYETSGLTTTIRIPV
jgi:two-component sensor histidine kinase